MLDLREPSVAILGVAIDNLTMQEVLDAVEAEIAEGGFHQIATANVDFLMNSVHDEELRETLIRCDIVLADGMPLVWASRLLGTRLKERVAGADLVPQLAKLSAQRGYRIFLLGRSEESSAGAADWMQKTSRMYALPGDIVRSFSHSKRWTTRISCPASRRPSQTSFWWLSEILSRKNGWPCIDTG